MRYGSIYLVVKDFDKSVEFYEKVLDMKVSATNGKRFAMFNNDGLNLCLMNGYYDDENQSQVITKGEYWEIYDNQSEIATQFLFLTKRCHTAITLPFISTGKIWSNADILSGVTITKYLSEMS